MVVFDIEVMDFSQASQCISFDMWNDYEEEIYWFIAGIKRSGDTSSPFVKQELNLLKLNL